MLENKTKLQKFIFNIQIQIDLWNAKNYYYNKLLICYSFSNTTLIEKVFIELSYSLNRIKTKETRKMSL